MPSNSIQDRVSRLRWACKRTHAELDAPLVFFLEHCYVDLTMSERFSFERLLSSTDEEISDWLTGHKPPRDQGIGNVVESIRKVAITGIGDSQQSSQIPPHPER